ncbi:Serine/threonine-protein kinase ppk19 [Diplogelasinospora grovesii]|uniref:non-specific serine/threonine protein kinase n=1 Tax=Diplogelasinospora grovesii TaxID=303347 RepID=A0AAN6N5H4_9PEZI|nr:Serine/threonine-protein kinase ppk19 [Diplogelasinospora grovesii]
MGQGFSLATPPAGGAGIDVPELADLVYEKSIGAARFMKSIRARHHDGVVLVKVLIKPYPMSLESYKKEIMRERRALADVPNALPYQRAIETETNGYLVRQFLYNSLYDRLSTRPFLEEIEKKWLAFQLLCGLRDCHAKDIYHGDIKTENTLVTSWNWLYLSDFSSAVKPVMLPEDNPADFSYFFDTSGRRTCYLAPERFMPTGEEAAANARVTWAMDVFSAGCVIAELFVEAPIFNLSQLYKYKRGEYDPAISHLSRIPDKDLRDMIAHMIQLDPQKRYSAEQYLEFWKGKVFPEYFYSFLHQYMELITDVSAGLSSSPGVAARNVLSEADQRIERVWLDFDKISYFLGYQNETNPPEKKQHQSQRQLAPRLGLGHFPVRLNIPNNEHYVSADRQPSADDGTLIFLTLIVSSLRNTAHAAAKIKACDILLAFAERLTDEAKLDRVLPYLMTLLNDKCDMVVVAALRSITQLLDLVKVITPVNSQIFLEYILPRMQTALLGTQHTPSPIIRATYASSLGKLAVTANRFLAMAATLRADGSALAADPEVEPGNEPGAAYDALFDNTRRELAELFEVHTKMLIEDSDPYVRRAFLSSVPGLCFFFGATQANDIILTHLNTYLNDRDWMLKCAFFDTIVSIAVFLGSSTLEKFILPIMIQAVTDPEEYVVQGALHSLAELANLGLLTKQTFVELVGVVGRFTMHPNIWIRESAAEFLSAGERRLSPASLRVLVTPQLKPYLKPGRLPEFSELALLDALQKPLSRSVFDQALLWASKSERGTFWKPLKKLRDLTMGPPSSGDGRDLALSKVPRNEEDEQWLSKLRNLGLAQEDEPKLLALREFIWRLSQIKARDANAPENPSTTALNSIIPLRTLGVTPQTVLFDEEPIREFLSEASQDTGAPRTIKDALLDASMTIDDPVSKRRRAALNSHKSRLNSRDNLSPMSANGRRSLDDELSRQGRSGDSSRRTSGGKSIALSPLDDDASSLAPYRRTALRHQSSAMSLLNRKDSNKSGPETGTTETNAFGEVEGPFAQNLTPRIPLRDPEAEDWSRTRLHANHTYTGNDPSILKMLDSMYVENYPHDIAEYGPLVTPISRRKSSSKSTSTGTADDGWRPSGKFVATFAEHVGSINRIVVSPDHLFFLTGGDDGCVKVWDTARLERNIAHRSRLTHRHAPGAKVLAMCFIENTHSFISCASDGSVHVVKVETSHAGGTVRYPKVRLLREHQLLDGEFAVWCEHFKHENNSVLLMVTNKSVILGIDLRTMTLLYRLENPVHHGTPTCFCVDRKKNWLCLGTSHGVLDLWDLRFKMRLKGWGVPGKGPIYRVSVHPTKGRGKWVCVAGGTGQGEVTVWDLERTLCREIYRVGGNKEGPKGYDAWEVDEDKPEGMLGRYATNILTEPSAIGGSNGSGSMGGDRGVRAMITGISQTDPQREVRHAFIITGGSDKRLRYWDLSRIENSLVYSGLQADEGRPTFTASHPTTSMTLNTERWPRNNKDGASGDGGGAGGSTKGKSSGKTNTTTTNTQRPPRSTVISLQHQQLLKSHLDAIMDVALLESPYTMTVSADRSGVVFVFQ